jgi:hypothetical protein
MSRNTGSVQRGRLRRLEVEATYAAAISRVARIGNFNALHKAVRFTSRGRVFPVSQRYMLATLTPAFSATSATLSPRCNIKTPITFGNPTNDKLSERSVRVRIVEFAGSKDFARMS